MVDGEGARWHSLPSITRALKCATCAASWNKHTTHKNAEPACVFDEQVNCLFAPQPMNLMTKDMQQRRRRCRRRGNYGMVRYEGFELQSTNCSMDDEHSTVQLSLKCDPFDGQIAQRHTWLIFQNTNYVWCCVRRRCIQLWTSVSISWHRIQHFTFSLLQRNGKFNGNPTVYSRFDHFDTCVVCFHFFWLSSSFMWCGMHVNYLNHICRMYFQISCRLNAAMAPKRT